MANFKFDIYTKFSLWVDVEADTKEEAEAILWERYNNGEIDPMDTNDIETNTQYMGAA